MKVNGTNLFVITIRLCYPAAKVTATSQLGYDVTNYHFAMAAMIAKTMAAEQFSHPKMAIANLASTAAFGSESSRDCLNFLHASWKPSG